MGVLSSFFGCMPGQALLSAGVTIELQSQSLSVQQTLISIYKMPHTPDIR